MSSGGVGSNALQDTAEKAGDESAQGVVGTGLSADSGAPGDSKDCELGVKQGCVGERLS